MARDGVQIGLLAYNSIQTESPGWPADLDLAYEPPRNRINRVNRISVDRL